MRQAKSYKKRRTGRAYFPPEPENKSNIEKMCVLCKYHPSNTQTEMPSVVKTKQILVGFKDWYNRQRKSPILFVEIDEYLSQLKGGE